MQKLFRNPLRGASVALRTAMLARSEWHRVALVVVLSLASGALEGVGLSFLIPLASAFAVLPLCLETEAQQRAGGFGEEIVFNVFDRKSPTDRMHPLNAGRMGTGANMVFSVAALRRIGGFDEALDTGVRILPARPGRRELDCLRAGLGRSPSSPPKLAGAGGGDPRKWREPGRRAVRPVRNRRRPRRSGPGLRRSPSPESGPGRDGPLRALRGERDHLLWPWTRGVFARFGRVELALSARKQPAGNIAATDGCGAANPFA